MVTATGNGGRLAPATQPGEPFIGALISLISSTENRWEGELQSIDQASATIVLKNVRSHGTEGRKTPNMPASNELYPFVRFEGHDIKSLNVIEPMPSYAPPQHNLYGMQPPGMMGYPPQQPGMYAPPPPPVTAGGAPPNSWSAPPTMPPAPPGSYGYMPQAPTQAPTQAPPSSSSTVPQLSQERKETGDGDLESKMKNLDMTTKPLGPPQQQDTSNNNKQPQSRGTYAQGVAKQSRQPQQQQPSSQQQKQPSTAKPSDGKRNIQDQKNQVKPSLVTEKAPVIVEEKKPAPRPSSYASAIGGLSASSNQTSAVPRPVPTARGGARRPVSGGRGAGGGGRSNDRGGRHSVPPRTVTTGPTATPKTYNVDFDFESMNTKFNKEELKGTESAQVSNTYVKDDFFDTMSCEALDKAAGAAAQKDRRELYNEQRKLDLGYQGRGRGRGQYNNNYSGAGGRGNGRGRGAPYNNNYTGSGGRGGRGRGGYNNNNNSNNGPHQSNGGYRGQRSESVPQSN